MSIDAATIDSASAARPAVRVEQRWTRDGDSGETSTVRDDLSFWDFLDVINPLQHIPVVGTLYRAITGDTIQPASRVVGGILYGGPVGGMAAVANAVVEQTQGKDVGDQIMASLGLGADDHPAAPVATAAVTGGPATGSPIPSTAVAADQTATQPAGALPAGPQASGPQSAQAALQAALRTAEGGQGPLPAPSGVGGPGIGGAGGQPIRLGAGLPPAAGQTQQMQQVQQAQAQAQAANAALAAQLAGQDGMPLSRPTKMPARDTNLANTLQARHAASRVAAPLHGSVGGTAATAGAGTPSATAATQAQTQAQTQPQPQAPIPGGQMPVSPDRLSETMMRNLAKYEQSRRATQPVPATAVRVSG